MSDAVVEARWTDGHRFEAVGRGGVPVIVDGGAEAGPTPMETVLVGLATCMGSDVVDILRKMRVPFEGLAVRVEGNRRPEPPRRYTGIRLTYRVAGVADGDRAKLQRAVELSRDKYCSVIHTLRPDVDVAIAIEAG
ncbi:MAG: OsmC family protein [Gemmatimonadota bacterium]